MVRFSDSKSHAIAFRMLTDNKSGSELPGWFIAPKPEKKVFCGPCTIDVSRFSLSLEHLAIQQIVVKRPDDRIAWIPLTDETGEIVQYLHLYNRYIDDKSMPASFRVQSGYAQKYDKTAYQEYEL